MSKQTKSKLFVYTALMLLMASSMSAMTLNEAIDTALKQSPVFLIKKQNILQAKEEKRAKKGQSFGHVDLVGSYTTYNIPRTLVPIVPPITSNIVVSDTIASLGVKYDVLLFNGFSDMRSVEIAELGKKISQTDLELTKAQLIYNIKSLYFKIVTLKKQKGAMVAYQEALERLYTNVKQEVALGKKAKIDLLKVASDLESAKYSVTSLHYAIEGLKAKLSALIGVEEIGSIETPQMDETIENQQSVKATYSYQKARYDLQKSKKAIEKAKGLYYPKVALNTYYGSNYGAGSQRELWQAGVSLNLPLFDFGNRSAQLEKAKVGYRIAELNLKNRALKLQSDRIDAKARIAEAKAKVTALRKQLALLKKIEETERIKYHNGVSDMYDLLVAIAKHKRAESDLIGAIYDLTMQKAYLNYIMAGEK